MAKDASILVQARTEGSLAVPAVGSPRSLADAVPPPKPGDPAAPIDATAPEPRELPAAELLLATEPPPNVAILHVQPHALDHDRWAFSLLGASSVRNLLRTTPCARPKLVLANLAQDADPRTSLLPSQILAVMRTFSKDNRAVPLWVNELRAVVDDDLHLVIVDHTGFEIPWELLTLPATSQGGTETYLGAAVSTARWQSIYDDLTFADRLLQVCDEEHAGRVAAFVDMQDLPRGGQETGVLAELGAVIEQSLRQLEDRLTRPETGFGLIYLACHGHWAPSLLSFALGSASEAGERLVLGLLQTKQLRLFEQSKAIVFINACHSGRMFKEDEYLDSARLRGFPELFLGKGAAGVIGTTGFVNSAFAAKMADWLLRSLCATDEPVTKLLRRWRAAVVERLPDIPSEHNKVELLNAFMYVYYGNPLTRLRIVEGAS